MVGNLHVKVTAGSSAGRVLVIPEAGATIGRGELAEIRLDEPSVSREHCCIYYYRHDWFVQDLDSQNGTFVNGRKIEKERLKAGDRIGLGVVVLRVPRGVPVGAIAAGVVAVALLAAFLLWLRRAGTANAPSAGPNPNVQSQNAANDEQSTPQESLRKYLRQRHSEGLVE